MGERCHETHAVVMMGLPSVVTPDASNRSGAKKAKMAKRILVITAVVLLLVYIYVSYTKYDAKRAGAGGDVYTSEGSSATPSRTTVPTRDTSVDSRSAADTAIVYPPSNQSSTAMSSTGQTAQPGVSGTAAPASDSISPNPPNGMVFSGTGRYQLYRQGNITWRLDTNNGQSCVIFATDEEWRKPRVLRAGCGKS